MQLIFFLLGILVLLHSSQVSTQPTRFNKTRREPTTPFIECGSFNRFHWVFAISAVLNLIMAILMFFWMRLDKRRLADRKKEVEVYRAANKTVTEKKDGMTHDETKSV